MGLIFTQTMCVAMALLLISCNESKQDKTTDEKLGRIVDSMFVIRGHYCIPPPNTIQIERTHDGYLRTTCDFDSSYSMKTVFTSDKKDQIKRLFKAHLRDSLPSQVSGCSAYTYYELLAGKDTIVFNDPHSQVYSEFLRIGEIEPQEIDSIVIRLRSLDSLSIMKSIN